MKKERDEKVKNKFNRKKLFIYIATLLILLYLFYAVYLLIKQPSNKVMVEKGTLYQEETNIGYIIRNEQVVKGNNYKNGMEQIKAEGEKAAKGDSIYRYYSKNETELKEKIAELDFKIQETLKGQTNLYSSDVKMLENQLDEKIEMLSKLTDLSKISEYKKQINDIVLKKAKISGETSAAGSYLKELYTQRTSLEEELNSGAEYINAPESGIVSYKVDGLEEILMTNDFSKLTKKNLEELKLKTGQLIATNNECGKIIDSTRCYIATISDSEQSKKAEVEDIVKLRLSNNKIINAKIVYISQEDEEEVIIVLEIDKQIRELANYRKISFDIIWWSTTGLKVPNQAIVQENGLDYVVRNRAGYLSKILIKVTKKYDKYSIVKNYDTEELKNLGYTSSQITNMRKIYIYDELILNPDITQVK